MKHVACLAVLLLPALAFPAATAGAGAATADETPVPAAVHVHSRFSTGEKSLEELARDARARGLGAILLAENHLARIDYGVFPFRRVVRASFSNPSVLSRGPEEFLAAVERARRAVPEVVIVPGVEVIPHYRWTGSLLSNDLTLLDAQRNLLVFGPEAARDYREIPSIGSPGGQRFDLFRLVLALLGLAAAARGILALRRPSPPAKTFEWEGRRFAVPARRRFRLGALALLALAALLLAEGIPPTAQRFSPYGPDPGLVPAQAVIDWARGKGFATAWSLPEASASDVREYPFGVRVRHQTYPHPQVLAETRGFDAFGAIAADTTHATDPGGAWDRLLSDAAKGRRTPAYALGEISYHGTSGEGKGIAQIQTVFFARSRTPAGILEAFKAGRFYARRAAGPGKDLRLDAFRLDSPRRLSFSIFGFEGKTAEASWRVILDGRVWKEGRGSLPIRWEGEIPAGGPARGFVRLEVKCGDAWLLSNPLFFGGGSR